MTFSRFALILAVSVSACTDRTPVGPQASQGYRGAPGPLPTPTDVKASLVDRAGKVVLTWSYPSDATAEFLVERAGAPQGPWSFASITRQTSMSDFIADGLRRCYRVAAVTGAPSYPVCVRPEKL